MSAKKDTGVIRSIDRIGRLVLPIELRRELGINDGEPVQMYVENGKIIVEKYIKRCFICGRSSDEYTTIKNKRICQNCKNEINGLSLTQEESDLDVE